MKWLTAIHGPETEHSVLPNINRKGFSIIEKEGMAMRGNRFRISMLAALTVFFISAASVSGIGEEKVVRAALRGLEILYVSVEELQPNIKGKGLSEDQIKSDIEIKLRTAGIKVNSNTEWRRSPGSPWLFVKIATNKGPQAVAYHIRLELRESVCPRRDPQITISATTWAASSLGALPIEQISKIRYSVQEQVDGFIGDYLAANPKKKKDTDEYRDLLRR